ncbi:MAG: helix-turn-helix domain-containing protein [Lentisphaeria bacterium]|nr:helix-turn-helix domain-containing protein [Lentisphaeria bacterium]
MKVLPKIVQVLELFSNGDTLPFAEIVKRTRLTRSNAAHILSALCENQLLAKSSFGHYCVGRKLYELTGGYCRQNILNMLAQRSADRIATELGELGVVVACWQAQRITLAKVQPESMVQLSIADRWFEKSGWYRLSSGRLLLALQDDLTVKTIIDHVGLPSPAEWPEAFTREKLQCEIAAIRQQRFAAVMRENSRLTSLAVPVKDAAGQESLCVSTVYITGRKKESDDEIRAVLEDIAGELHEQICFHNIVIQNISYLTTNPKH